MPVVNGLRGTAHLFAWQVQHLESRGAACGERSPRDGHFFAWQVQHLESLAAAYGQRSPRDRAPFYVAGAPLGAPDAAFAWQVQHLESPGAQLISHNSSHTTHLPQLHLHYFTYTTHLPQLTSHNSSYTTPLAVLLASWYLFLCCACTRLFPSCLVCAKLPPSSADAAVCFQAVWFVQSYLRDQQMRRDLGSGCCMLQTF